MIYSYYLLKKYSLSIVSIYLLSIQILYGGFIMLMAGYFYQLHICVYLYVGVLFLILTLQSTIRVSKKSDIAMQDAISKFHKKKRSSYILQYIILSLVINSVLLILAHIVNVSDSRIIIAVALILLMSIIMGVLEWSLEKYAANKLSDNS